MTLIPCPECQKPISADAIACPQCGHPLKRYCWPAGYLGDNELRAMQRSSIYILCAALIVGIVLMFFVATKRRQALPEPAPPAQAKMIDPVLDIR
jgi:hypothetical protein